MEPGLTVCDLQQHWDSTYAANPIGVSWYQPTPTVSLELIEALGVGPEAAVIDVGGGASPLVDKLLARGFSDVTVLDVSAVALETARRRLGPAAERVHWLHEDLRHWAPARSYGLRHDRAVFHFLVDHTDQERYRQLLAAAVAPGGGAIIATFSPDGPARCSGLPVARYRPDDLATAAGPQFEVVAVRHEHHTTPGATVQPFVWVALRHTGS